MTEKNNNTTIEQPEEKPHPAGYPFTFKVAKEPDNKWKYADSSRLVVNCVDDDGMFHSMFASELAEGTVIADPDEPPVHLALAEQIASLESSVTQRRLREAIIANDFSYIQGIDDQIAELRTELRNLPKGQL